MKALLLSFGFCLLGFISACNPFSSSPLNLTLPEVGEYIGIQFPSDTKLLEFEEVAPPIDPIWIAKISMSLSSFEILKSTIFEKQENHYKVENFYTKEVDWWILENIFFKKQYFYTDKTGSCVVVIYASMKDDDTVLLYIKNVVL